MKYITNEVLKSINLTPSESVELVKKSFLLKKDSLLPHKISISFEENRFFNTMPVILKDKLNNINLMGIKVVNRYPKRSPSVDGEIFIYNYETGKLEYILDAFFITAARTGAVCALAVNTLAIKNFETIAIMGLGNTARSSLFCILETNKDKNLIIKLLKYKTQAEEFIDDFKGYNNVSFKICNSKEDFIRNSDIIISCITYTDDLIADISWFKNGCLLVPVHTRGFQNCDLVFDRIFADDIKHISNFKYFNQYKNFDEISNILSGKNRGRINDRERIISYNIGIALHDIIFAKCLIDKVEANDNIRNNMITIQKNNNNKKFSFYE